MKDIDFSTGVHAFMRANTPLDAAGKAKLNEFVTYARSGARPGATQADFCLASACSYAQADKLATLVDQYGADTSQHSDLQSDRHPGQNVRMNLLEDTLMSYNVSPDSDRSAAGRKRLAQTVEFLLQHGVSAAPNPDPHEGAVAEAYAMAYPDCQAEGFEAGLWAAFGRAADPASAGKDGFREPYELIRKYQLEAVERLEKTLHVKSHAPNENAQAQAPGWKKRLNAFIQAL